MMFYVKQIHVFQGVSVGRFLMVKALASAVMFGSLGLTKSNFPGPCHREMLALGLNDSIEK